MGWLDRWRRGNALGEGVAVARPHHHAPQVLVDVSVIYRFDARSGIQRVVRGILLQLLEKGIPGHRVRLVFARRDQGYHYAAPDFLTDPSPTAAWRSQATVPVTCGKNDIFLGLDLAAHLLPRHRRQIARWKASGVTIHLLVYDLLPVRQSQWFERKTVRNFTRWLKVLAQYCDGAICISQHTCDELHDWLNHHRPARVAHIRMSVIRLGADIAATAPSRGIGTVTADFFTQVADRPFVLMVGTVEPRKAFEVAICGFEKLWGRYGDTAPDLILVGQPGWKTEALQQHLRSLAAKTRKFLWFDDASDDLLDCLYRACCGVIVPSYAEGFGLPVDEASLRGKPVLARDLAVFRETGRPTISFFRDDADFEGKLARWFVQLQRESTPVMDPRGWDVTREDLCQALGIDTCEDDDDRALHPPAASAAAQPALLSQTGHSVGADILHAGRAATVAASDRK